jgi:hypothetical protein
VLCVFEGLEFLDLRIAEVTPASGAGVPGEVDVTVDGKGDDRAAMFAAIGVQVCPSSK